MSRKLTYEYVYNYFEENNCLLLETEYKNNQTLMRYKCVCGEESKIIFSHFKREVRCNKCGAKKTKEKQKHTLKYIKQYFEKNDCKLLEKEYINNKTLMKYKCSCKNISKICFNSFKNGNRCKKCGIKKRSERRKLSFNYVKQCFKDQNCELLEIKYIDGRTLMKYKCNCGNMSKITFGSFKRGTRCMKCASLKRSGINSNLYNFNLTDEERKEKRWNSKSKQWTKYIYKKYNYTCQKCSHRGGQLNAHHIESWASNKKLRIAKSNGITFCIEHHKEFHKIYGSKNNNQQQLDNFLKVK